MKGLLRRGFVWSDSWWGAALFCFVRRKKPDQQLVVSDAVVDAVDAVRSGEGDLSVSFQA
jgi:hypothetical protein